MKEVVLYLLLDSHLLKCKVKHVGLEDYELIFWGFLDAEELVLHFYDVCKAMGLVGVFSGLVDESKIVGVITDQNCIEIGKHLKICYDFIDSKRSDLWYALVPSYAKHGDVFFLSAYQVKSVGLFTVAKDGDDFMMRESAELLFGEGFVVEGDLVACNETNGRNSDDFEDYTDLKIIVVDLHLLLYFLRFASGFLHIIQIHQVILLWDGEPFVEHLQVIDPSHPAGHVETQ